MIPATQVIVFDGAYRCMGRHRADALARWRAGVAPDVTVWREVIPAGPGDVPRGALTPADILWDK